MLAIIKIKLNKRYTIFTFFILQFEEKKCSKRFSNFKVDVLFGVVKIDGTFKNPF